MNWALGAVLLFCGGAMMLDGRADGERIAGAPVGDDNGGAALFIAGLVVALSGVFVLIGAARGALGGGG